MTQNTQIEALKPCPFCGGTFVAQGASRDYISVWCDCGARGPEVKFPENCDPLPPIYECHAAWNRRALREAPVPSEEPVAMGWREIDDEAVSGKRILLLWKPAGGLSEHVELGRFSQSATGWVNTYGKPFSSAPDKWAPLAPFASPAVAPVAVSVKGLEWSGPNTLADGQIVWSAILSEIRAELERVREALATADEAIAEYVRYLDGGEMRGSYDGKPEREALRKAGYATRAALSALAEGEKP